MIPFLDLAKVNNRFRSEIDARFARILDKGWYLQGEENETFFKHFADYCGTKYAVGVANGCRVRLEFGVGGENKANSSLGKIRQI